MILTDSGFWLALINSRDRFHQQARTAVAAIAEPFGTTWPVMTETLYIIMPYGSRARARLRDLFFGGGVELLDFTRPETERMLDLMDRYADLPMDFADASLVAAAERLDDGRILTTDERDFDTYRWRNRHTFKNLLLHP